MSTRHPLHPLTVLRTARPARFLARGGLLTASALALFAGCAGGAADDDGDHGTSVAKNAFVVDEATANEAIVEEAKVTIPALGHEALLSRKLGDVLVAPRGKVGTTGNAMGFLRRVRSVSRDGDKIVVLTDPAALTDVVENGEVSGHYVIDAADLSKAATQQLDAPPALGTKGLDVEKTIDISGKTLDTGVPGLTITIKKGKLGFKAGLDLGAKISWFSLKEFHAIANGSLDASFELEVDYKFATSFSKKFETTIYKSPPSSLPPMWIGPVPVSAGVTVEFRAGCEATLSGGVNLDVGAEASSAVSLGVKYDGGWTPISTHSLKFSRIGPTATAAVEAKLKCYIAPQVAIMFYGVVGGYLEVQPYAAFDIDPTLGCPWRLHAGVDGHAGGKFEILGYKLAAVDKKLFGFDTNLASGSLGGWCGK